jgi:hypothetical protein
MRLIMTQAPRHRDLNSTRYARHVGCSAGGMNHFNRLLIPVALLQVLACSDAVEEPSAEGAGGSTPGETASSTSGGAAPDSAEDPSEDGSGGSNSSASSGAGVGPVACDQGAGAPPGAACEVEGERCDYACSPCSVTCTDGIWVEHCKTCPSLPPKNGTDCSDFVWVEPCSYALECGTATATCDAMTGLWGVDGADCGETGEGGNDGIGCY